MAQKILPQKLACWQAVDSMEIYDRNNLYDYIDGGAELYLSYGFKRLFHQTYQCEGKPDILVDVFDMGSSDNAFGIFMHGREDMNTTFGEGSEYVQGFLNFYKGKYYVTILAMQETSESKEALFQMARYIEDRLPHSRTRKKIVALLPESGLLEESIRYFHHYLWLNHYIHISDENILQIEPDCDVLMARYENGGLFILIRYPDSIRARHVVNTLPQYFPKADKAGKTTFWQERWFVWWGKGPYLLLVFHRGSAEACEKLLQNGLSKLPL